MVVPHNEALTESLSDPRSPSDKNVCFVNCSFLMLSVNMYS